MKEKEDVEALCKNIVQLYPNSCFLAGIEFVILLDGKANILPEIQKKHHDNSGNPLTFEKIENLYPYGIESLHFIKKGGRVHYKDYEKQTLIDLIIKELGQDRYPIVSLPSLIEDKEQKNYFHTHVFFKFWKDENGLHLLSVTPILNDKPEIKEWTESDLDIEFTKYIDGYWGADIIVYE
jgi:hypothetical protein